MKVAITNNAKLLAIFAIVCTLIVAVVNELTKEKINQQAEQYLLTTLHSIIEPERLNNDMYHDCLMVSDPLLGNKTQQTIYLARLNETPVAAAITATAPDGYNGNIELLVAINADGSISGVRTLQHNETPGLGDKVELRKSSWITSFSGNVLDGENDSRWAVKKDGGMFDQFTGATITPRAVVKAVRKAVIYFEKNKTFLFSNSSADNSASCRG
ncbi:electron transport complex subunit RsxG [Thalassotalea agariperforans]